MTEPIKPLIQFIMVDTNDIRANFNRLTFSNVVYSNAQALTYLKFRANQQKSYVSFTKNGCTVALQLGQFVTTYKQLEAAFNWGKGKLRYNVSKWVKSELISKLELKNEHRRSVGLLITCNSLIEFRKNIENQRLETEKNYKNTSQFFNTIKAYSNQEKTESSTPKSIKGNTYKNNIENHNPNSLIFEANKKLYEVNSKILEEKRKQEEELLILRNALKKEKTRNNQSKSMKRFEVSGEIKSDKIKYNWDFQDTAEFKQIFEKLTSFGFERFAINKLWWNNSTNIQKLSDFIDYTQMKFDQGKVKDKKRFLYHAIQANYDLGELEKARQKAKSQEEKDWIEDKKRAEELKSGQIELNQREQQKTKQQEEFKLVRTWIKNNPQDPLFEQVLGQLEQENQFMITRLTTKARKQGIWNIADYLRSDLISELDLGLSGLLKLVGTKIDFE